MTSYPPLQIVRLFADAKLPVRSNPTDSGLDVFVHNFEQIYAVNTVINEATKSVKLYTNDRVLINCGFSATVGDGYEIQLRPRSGNALKKGLTVLNSPGTIDASYRGFIGAIVVNLGHQLQEIYVGDKIAQIVVMPVILSDVIEVETLGNTNRGAGGFGHTDEKK